MTRLASEGGEGGGGWDKANFSYCCCWDSGGEVRGLLTRFPPTCAWSLHTYVNVATFRTHVYLYVPRQYCIYVTWLHQIIFIVGWGHLYHHQPPPPKKEKKVELFHVIYPFLPSSFWGVFSEPTPTPLCSKTRQLLPTRKFQIYRYLHVMYPYMSYIHVMVGMVLMVWYVCM